MTLPSPNPCYAPKLSKAGLWHGPTSADLRSAHGLWAPEGWDTRADHPSCPGHRIGTDRKCLNGCPPIPGGHACTPRAAPPGLGDPCSGRSQIMVFLVAQPGRPFVIFFCHQASKFVSRCWAHCWALSRRASSVGCSSSDSLKDVSSLELGRCIFCCISGVFSS